ncbi:two-component sensor histidine kinase [Moraxella caviae]|uniref:histidine kinase n=1 Tax=Moraxella caviae TaxID=34060 RepID=A0A1S9ZXQ3_9GAMM|nr:ATP-binding protein [Moraxella caviae]OOR88284.1 two-component sensor histidine kinase [Moraxella caviae]STZ13879.1 Sensor protein RstB [Moraxella caviae]VEW11163.1 Sensor protein RstB [Moraxella caviae]
MAKISLTERSIFFRIYAGLLLVCVSVAFFAYLLVDTINQERIQSYRETVSSGVFYLVSQGIAHQTTESARSYWLNDASSLFGEKFSVVPMDSVALKGREVRRLNAEQAVVRYNPHTKESTIYQRITGEDNLLTVTIDQVSERQVRAMTIFLLDDLSYYPTMDAKRQRLEFLSKKFSHPIRIRPIQSLDLDPDQIARLRRDEPVLLFQDGDSVKNSTISVVVASELDSAAIVIGPVGLFNWFPLNLLISVVLISMLLISLGVYGLIFPLERRLQLLQAGVDRVAKGDLNTKVQVVGHDDVAKLSSTFNAMTAHIKRLIESQRELTRAVSHELRTPVARIRFAVDMLADEDDYDSRQVQKNFIDEDIESLNELIDEILTYAKLEEGSPRLDWEMVGLADLVRQIERETNAMGKDIRVQVNVPNAKAVAMADRKYLHRVVQNLAGNAMRYADSTILISAGIKKGVAFVSVEDDGHGIPEADREKVFIPFARLDDSRTRASGGYGLGLSIVSRIAFWFNATMKVDESPTLHGARFIMEWPVKQVGVVVAADELTQAKSDQVIMGKTKDGE